MKRHAGIGGRLSGSVQILLLFPILLSGCATPPQISTNQISREHKERIRAMSVVPPLNPKQLEIVDANSGLGAKVTGSILGGLIGGLVVGIGESSEAKAASEMTRKFAERSSDIPFDPARFLASAIQDTVRKAGYSVHSIDATNRNSRTFLSQKEYRNLRFVGDAVLECRVNRCGYLKEVPDMAFWPFVDIDLRIASVDGKQVLFNRKFLNVDLKWGGELWLPPLVVHPQTDPQFQDLEQMILNRQAAVRGGPQPEPKQSSEHNASHASGAFLWMATAPR